MIPLLYVVILRCLLSMDGMKCADLILVILTLVGYTVLANNTQSSVNYYIAKSIRALEFDLEGADSSPTPGKVVSENRIYTILAIN